MAITDKTTLRSYFETDDIPTQTEFEELIEAFFHKSEDIELATGKRIIVEGYSMLEIPTVHVITPSTSEDWTIPDQEIDDLEKIKLTLNGTYLDYLYSLRTAISEINDVLKNHKLTINP